MKANILILLALTFDLVLAFNPEKGEFLGALTARSNGIAGDVYAGKDVSKNYVVVEGFSYDGLGGEEVFFYAGKKGLPSVEDGQFQSFPEASKRAIEVKQHKQQDNFMQSSRKYGLRKS